MKKVAPIVAGALLGMMFTSCKKDYTCDCSVNGTYVGSTTVHTTKGKAKTACTTTSSFGGVTASCVLK